MENPVERAELLFAEGKLEDARVLLERATGIAGLRARALSDLGVLAASEGNAALAVRRFEAALRADPYQRAALLNLFDCLEPWGESGRAEPFLQRAATRRWGDAEIADRLACLEARDPGRPRLAFLLGGESGATAGELVARLCGEFCVRSAAAHDGPGLQRAVSWADVVWLEATPAAARALTRDDSSLEGKRVVCRVRARDVFAEELTQVAWERVSDLVFGADSVRRRLLARIPEIGRRVRAVHVIPRGIDAERFPLSSRPRGKRLAFVGPLGLGNGTLLLQAFAALAGRDPGWQLHVAGQRPDAPFESYLRRFVAAHGLEDRIELCGPVEDMATWLADRDFAVWTGALDGTPPALLEAMACGLKPLIHESFGARELYPGGFLWRTVDEFVRCAEARDFERAEYRDFVLRRYTAEHQARQTLALLGRGQWSEPDTAPIRSVAPEARAPVRAAEEAPRLEATPLQPWIRQRLRELIAPGDSVLHLDCGSGETSAFIRALGVRDLVGVDPSPEAIARARRAHPEIEFRVAGSDPLDCGRSFDFIALTARDGPVPVGLFEMLARHSHAGTLVWMSLPDPARERGTDGEQLVSELLERAGRGFRLVSFASSGIEAPFGRAEFLWTRAARALRPAYCAAEPAAEA